LLNERIHPQVHVPLPSILSRTMFGSPIFNIPMLRGTIRDDNEFIDEVPLFMPAVDVHDTEKEVTIELDVAGCNKNDVDVRIEDGVLIIEGERSSQRASHPEFLIGDANLLHAMSDVTKSENAEQSTESGEDEDGGSVHVWREREFGHFSRAFALPTQKTYDITTVIDVCSVFVFLCFLFLCSFCSFVGRKFAYSLCHLKRYDIMTVDERRRALHHGKEISGADARVSKGGGRDEESGGEEPIAAAKRAHRRRQQRQHHRNSQHERQ
jgi:HSP20 family molecular chaperone IbpA